MADITTLIRLLQQNHQQGTKEQLQGEALGEALSSMEPDSPMTAIIKGIGTGASINLKAKGNLKQQEQQERYRKILEQQLNQAQYLEQREQYLQNLEQMLITRQKQKELLTEKQEPIDEAVEIFAANEELTPLNRLVQGDNSLREMVSTQLPPGIRFREFRRLDKTSQIVASGTDNDGREVLGEPFDPLTFASPSRQAEIMRKLRK